MAVRFTPVFLVCVIVTVNCTCALGFLCGSDLWLLFLVGYVFVAFFFLVAEYIQQREERKKNNEQVATKPQQTLCSRV